LCWFEQTFEEEMANLPGCYAAPHGAILIASVMTKVGPQDAGAVAVRPLPHKDKHLQGSGPAANGTSGAALSDLQDFYDLHIDQHKCQGLF